MDDPKLANVLYHDWEAATYDEKWSISYDERCIDYARDRFEHVAGGEGWPYGDGARARLRHRLLPAQPQAGRRARRRATSPTCRPAWSRSRVRNAEGLGFTVEGRVADAESIPYDDDTFDLVVGHAVLHHIPDLDLAMREVLRVLKPGGRFVFAGEPTEKGDWVARRLSRLTWWAATRVTHLAPAARGLGAAQGRARRSRRARRRWSRSSTSTPSTRTASRRCACAPGPSTCARSPRSSPRRGSAGRCAPSRRRSGPGALGWGWAMFAYGGWPRLSWLDENVLSQVVPDELFYNVCVTGTKPAAVTR